MQHLNESIIKSGANIYLLYSFLRRLATPFKKWKAYDLGIIDDKGNILRPRKSLSSTEKNDFSLFDLMILNMRKLLGRFSFGATTIASFAAALYLLKEHEKYQGTLLNESIKFDTHIDEERFKKIYEQLKEEMDGKGPTNSVSGVASKDDHSTRLFKKNIKRRNKWQQYLSKQQ
jgi:hypothetical protein